MLAQKHLPPPQLFISRRRRRVSSRDFFLSFTPIAFRCARLPDTSRAFSPAHLLIGAPAKMRARFLLAVLLGDTLRHRLVFLHHYRARVARCAAGLDISLILYATLGMA